MIKIGLIGGAGCGKSTQCAHFFSVLKYKSIQIEQIQEWVREAFNRKIIPIPKENVWAMLYGYEEQKKKEDCVPGEIEYIITDSPIFLSYIYALKYAKIPKDNYLIIKMYEYFINDVGRYDYLFLCARENSYQNDGTRIESLDDAIKVDKMIIHLLELHSIKYYILNGNIEERTRIMRNIIGI